MYGADPAPVEQRDEHRRRIGRVRAPAVDGQIERLALSTEPLPELRDRERPDVDVNADGLEERLHEERDGQRAGERVEHGRPVASVHQAPCPPEIGNGRIEPRVLEAERPGREVLVGRHRREQERGEAHERGPVDCVGDRPPQRGVREQRTARVQGEEVEGEPRIDEVPLRSRTRRRR